MPVRYKNYAKWRAALDDQRRALEQTIADAAPQVARYTRDCIRKRVPPDNTTRHGMSNPFPGYAATGRLKGQIVAGPRRKQGNRWSIMVGLAAHATRLDKIKAYVHEYGMVIRPRRKPYLVFQVEDQWVQTKRVRIRAKRFFRSGWEEARQKFPEIVGDYIKQRWPKRR